MADLGRFSSVDPVLFNGVDGASPISHATVDSAYRVAELGARVTIKGEEYVYIHNAAATDASIGRGMVMSSLSGYSLTVSSVAANYDVPWCVVKHVSIPAGGFGWGLVRGLSPIAVDTTAATGAYAKLGDDGIFSAFVGSATANAIMGLPLVKILSSGTGISTTGLAMGYVRCFG